MLEDIKTFFDKFVEDFSTFDGKLIASRYLAPYTAVSRDGDLWLCSNAQELVEYFQSLLDRHASQGVVRCKYEDLDCSSLGSNCFLATVTWTMLAEGDEVVSNWRESYNLINTPTGLKVYTSIDH
ncbi:MAG: hypothetical protein ACMZ64_02340 [Oleiphilus sp.]